MLPIHPLNTIKKLLRTSLMLQVLALMLVSFSLYPQQYKIGQWVDYLPHNTAFTVAKGGGKVYCATGETVFSVDLSDNSLQRMNKVSGLNDVGANLVRYNEYNNTLIVVYSNSNMDVIKGETVTNFSDIKRKNISADKTVYNISFYKEFAYIATGFGVVVFDTERMEFKDTYVVGNLGTNLEVYDVCRNADTIYAATGAGLKQAATASNLSNYQNWSNVAGLPGGAFKTVARLNNVFLASYSAKLTNGGSMKDTLYFYNGTSWSLFPKGFNSPNTYEIKRIATDEINNRIVLTDQWSCEAYQYNGSTFGSPTPYGHNLQFYDQNGNQYWPGTEEAIAVPQAGTNVHFLACALIGLVKTDGTNSSRILIDGPNSNMANQIVMQDGKMVIAPVYLSEILYPQYLSTGAYTYNGSNWNNLLKSPVNTLVDLNCAAFAYKDPNHYYIGSWGDGVAEFINDTLFKIHDETNSTLQPAATTTNSARVGGLQSDTSGILWSTNSLTVKILHAKKPNGTWTAFNFQNFVNYTTVVGKLMIDRNNQKWIQLPGIGFVVFNEGSNFSQPNASNTKLISTTVGNGGLPSAQVFAMCEDKEGDVWIGCDKGVAVFYNPENILGGGTGWDCQQIIVDNNGIAKILLETETVYDIVVDGENRKWIATRNGVFCLSSDGQKEIYHFTTDNSPLFSNTIFDIEYNGKTGDVFFATSEGIISFRSEVIDAFEEFTDVYSYPNPVRPGYEGPVVIKGMIQDAVVKITDITGTVVYETTSKGGQAIWYAKNFKGERVASGVYMVFCASSDGEQKKVTKILVVN